MEAKWDGCQNWCWPRQETVVVIHGNGGGIVVPTRNDGKQGWPRIVMVAKTIGQQKWRWPREVAEVGGNQENCWTKVVVNESGDGDQKWWLWPRIIVTSTDGDQVPVVATSDGDQVWWWWWLRALVIKNGGEKIAPTGDSG